MACPRRPPMHGEALGAIVLPPPRPVRGQDGHTSGRQVSNQVPFVLLDAPDPGGEVVGDHERPGNLGPSEGLGCGTPPPARGPPVHDDPSCQTERPGRAAVTSPARGSSARRSPGACPEPAREPPPPGTASLGGATPSTDRPGWPRQSCP